MDINTDYNAAFKSISVKLKKRFLRKPNVSDAIEEYTALSRQLENEECYGLSAYCMQQVAKCFHSVGNTVSESAALQHAAKQYLNSEISSSIESGTVTFNEDLLSAISLYEETIKLHCDKNERQLAGKLCLELADILAQKFDRHFESLPYYERAISLFTTNNSLTTGEQNISAHVVLILCKLAALKVYTCDYSGALESYSEICNLILNKCVKPNSTGTTSSSPAYNKPIGFYSKILVESDITKLLLLLYLKPTKMKSEYSNTLEVYSWFQTLSANPNSINYLPISCMDRDLFILLQSFVMACQSNDANILFTLSTELWEVLNDTQSHLINLIINQLMHSSYTDDLLSE